MSTRRTFLASSAALAVIPTLSFATRSDISAEIITDASCKDGEMFANFFATRSVNPGCDPLVFLQELHALVDDDGPERVFGLTSSSNRFLVEQTLAPLGFRRTYWGEHNYARDRLYHQFGGASPSLRKIATDVCDAQGNWAACIAGSLEQLVSGETVRRQVSVQVELQRPTNSTGFLCSWLLERA